MIEEKQTRLDRIEALKKNSIQQVNFYFSWGILYFMVILVQIILVEYYGVADTMASNLLRILVFGVILAVGIIYLQQKRKEIYKKYGKEGITNQNDQLFISILLTASAAYFISVMEVTMLYSIVENVALVDTVEKWRTGIFLLLILTLAYMGVPRLRRALKEDNEGTELYTGDETEYPVFTVTHVEALEVQKVKRDFMDYKSFSKVRTDKPVCDICGVQHLEADMLHLAFVKDKTNHVICSECAEKAEVNKVHYLTRG